MRIHLLVCEFADACFVPAGFQSNIIPHMITNCNLFYHYKSTNP